MEVSYAGLVWGYAVIWFLVTDPIKLLAYKVLDTIKADEAEDVPSPRRSPVAAPPALAKAAE